MCPRPVRPPRVHPPATGSPWPPARTTYGPPNGCATSCSPESSAPASTAPNPAWTATPSTRTATTCWCARRPPGRWSPPTGCCRPRAPGWPHGLYAEGEFDLRRLGPIRDDLVEVGRSCVHPAHRDGAVIALIWGGLARYMERTGHTWLVELLLRTARRRGSTGRQELGHRTDPPPGPRGVLGHPAPPLGHHGPPRRRRGRPRRTASAAARLSAARRLGLRSPRPRPGLRRRGPLRPALDAAHRPALPAPLPLAGPAAMSAWLPAAPCTPRECAHHEGARRPPAHAVVLLTAGCALTFLGVLCVPAVLLLGPAHRDLLIRRWARAVVRAFGVRVRVTGQPVERVRPMRRANLSSPTMCPGWTSRWWPPCCPPGWSPRARYGTGRSSDRSPRSAAPCSSSGTG